MRKSIRMQQVQEPITAKVGEWIQQHPGTIPLGQGMVSYGPPFEVRKYLEIFWQDPHHFKYRGTMGIGKLVKEIREKLKNDNQIETDNNGRIVVTAGANMAFVLALFAIADPGEQIIILSPFYFNHEMAIKMAGCTPVIVETGQDYNLLPAKIEAAITKHTRAVVTISPNNPTGAVYTKAALIEVNEICRRQKIYHICDEAYEYFTFEEASHFSPGSLKNSKAHTLSIFSLSKAYGFAGFRIGYMVFPENLLDSIKKIQDTILICPPVISQYAAIGALQAGRGYCKQKLAAIAEVREILLKELSQHSDYFEIPHTCGAFYFFIKIKNYRDSLKLAQQLISEYGVAIIPGKAFGIEDACYARVSYGALQKEDAAEACRRLITGIKSMVNY
ncbi:pyridoxal phosphate-dependent aminotransferase [Candidatus Riflebacteria bacterium]